MKASVKFVSLISLITSQYAISNSYSIALVNPPPSFKAPGTDSEDSQDSSDSGATAQKTREILARRPSYR